MARSDADKTLFERWLDQRDDDSFAEIARRHGPLVFDLAVRACGDRAVAEDVLQEALLNLALEKTRKPIEVGLVAWLARFAISRARNQRASEVSRTRRQRVVGGRRTEDVMPDSRLEQREELDRVLEQAEPEERVVLAMRYLHGWGYSRIAGALSVSEGAARVRVHRALRSVRSRVEQSDDRGVLAGLMAMPVIMHSPSALESTIGNVLGQAHAQLGTASATAGSGSGPVAPINRVARYLWKGAGLGLLVVGLGSTPAPRELAAQLDTARAAATALVWTAPPVAGEASISADHESAQGEDADPVPRPEGWDTGAIERLGRGEVEIGAQPAPVPTSGRPDSTPPSDVDEAPVAPGVTPPVHSAANAASPNRPSDTSRPNVREACAARCDTVSSDDERAGVSAGLTVKGHAAIVADVSTQETVVPAAADVDGATEQAASLRTRAPMVVLEDLDPEQLELVEEAAALLEPLVADDLVSGDLAELVAKPHRLRKQKRALRKQFRKMRREVREAALTGDAVAMDAAAAKAGRLSVFNDVLDTLISLTLSDRRADRRKLKFPKSSDVTRALEEVVRVLHTVDSRLPGGLESLAPPPGEVAVKGPIEFTAPGDAAAEGAPSADEPLDVSRLPGGVSGFGADRLPGGMLPGGGE